MKKTLITILALGLFFACFSQTDSLKNASLIGQSTRNQKVGQGLQVGFVGSSDDTLQINTKMQLLTGSPGTNKVLRSDANGFATWVSSLSTMVATNGLTESGDSIKLGGELIETTAIEFDPTTKYITIGDESNLIYLGNLLDDTNIYAGINTETIVAITADNGTNFANCAVNASTETPTAGLNCIYDSVDIGVFIFDNGGKKTANLYYGIRGETTTDISRVEANKNEVHGRHIIDSTGVIPNYNGWHSNDTYSQLEFNKIEEDGQLTGTLFTINQSGYSFLDDNSLVAFIDTFGNAVTNSLHTDSFKLTNGTEANGRTLTSNASGVATWGGDDALFVIDSVATTGDTVALAANTFTAIMASGAITDLVLRFPASPSNGDVVSAKFDFAVTTLSSDGQGKTINGFPSSTVLGQHREWRYNATTGAWY